MSLSRADLLLHLQSEFAALATDTGQATTDTAGGFGPAIDYALRQTGTAQADVATRTVPAGSEDDGLLLAEYAALRRFARALAGRVDISLDAPSASRRESQAFAQVKVLLDAVRKELEECGYLASAFTLGSLNLDIFEPEAV